MLDEFADALAEADAVAIANIWASRDPDTTITSPEASPRRRRGAQPGITVAAPGTVEETAAWLAGDVREGDAVLVMGGGRCYRIAEPCSSSWRPDDRDLRRRRTTCSTRTGRARTTYLATTTPSCSRSTPSLVRPVLAAAGRAQRPAGILERRGRGRALLRSGDRAALGRRGHGPRRLARQLEPRGPTRPRRSGRPASSPPTWAGTGASRACGMWTVTREHLRGRKERVGGGRGLVRRRQSSSTPRSSATRWTRSGARSSSATTSGARTSTSSREGRARPRDRRRVARDARSGPHPVEGGPARACRSRSSTGATVDPPAATRSARRSCCGGACPTTWRKLIKLIRDEFPKVKPQIQGDAVRVASKSKDDLQRVIARLRELDEVVELQFQNYR